MEILTKFEVPTKATDIAEELARLKPINLNKKGVRTVFSGRVSAAMYRLQDQAKVIKTEVTNERGGIDMHWQLTSQ